MKTPTLPGVNYAELYGQLCEAVAQAGYQMRPRAGYLDLVKNPRAIHTLPELEAAAKRGDRLEFTIGGDAYLLPPQEHPGSGGWVGAGDGHALVDILRENPAEFVKGQYRIRAFSKEL